MTTTSVSSTELGDVMPTAPFPAPFFGASLFGAEEIAATREVLESKSLFRYYGENVLGVTDAFEAEFAAYHRTRHALGLMSGTAALRTAFAALGVGPGDDVIVPAVTFQATPGSVVSMGARPVFVDVDESLGLDPEALGVSLTAATRAVVAVHLQGSACHIEEVVRICGERGIAVVEDCAQACGAEFEGRKLGSFGAAGAFSFQQNKLLSTGEGGALTTSDRQLDDRARVFHDQGGVREHGGFPSWDDERAFFGDNLRMSELTAAIARVQLERLPTMLERMRHNYRRLCGAAEAVGLTIRWSWDRAGDAGNALTLVARSEPERDEWLMVLASSGIPASGFYGRAVYEYDLYRRPRFASRSTAVPALAPGEARRAEDLMRRTVWILLPPSLTEEHLASIERGVETIAGVAAS